MPSPIAETLAILLLIATLGCAVLRPRGLPEAVVAAPAAILLVGLGVLPLHEARTEAASLGPTIGFLAAILVLATLCDRHGRRLRAKPHVYACTHLAADGVDCLVAARDGDDSRLGPKSLGKATRFVVDHAPCCPAGLARRGTRNRVDPAAPSASSASNAPTAPTASSALTTAEICGSSRPVTYFLPLMRPRAKS